MTKTEANNSVMDLPRMAEVFEAVAFEGGAFPYRARWRVREDRVLFLDTASLIRMALR